MSTAKSDGAPAKPNKKPARAVPEISGDVYKGELGLLQTELVKPQEWVRHCRARPVVI